MHDTTVGVTKALGELRAQSNDNLTTARLTPIALGPGRELFGGVLAERTQRPGGKTPSCLLNLQKYSSADTY